jgi:anti-sigma B factor antagonist
MHAMAGDNGSEAFAGFPQASPLGAGGQNFEVASYPRDDVLIVGIRGELDIVTSRELDESLAHARKTVSQIVLDLSAVDFMDSAALAVIVRHWRDIEAAGGSLSLAGPRYRYTKTLWITGLADRIPTYETTEAALAARANSDES